MRSRPDRYRVGKHSVRQVACNCRGRPSRTCVSDQRRGGGMCTGQRIHRLHLMSRRLEAKEQGETWCSAPRITRGQLW